MSQWEMDGVTTVELLIDLNTQKEFRKIDFPSNANIHWTSNWTISTDQTPDHFNA